MKKFTMMGYWVFDNREGNGKIKVSFMCRNELRRRIIDGEIPKELTTFFCFEDDLDNGALPFVDVEFDPGEVFIMYGRQIEMHPIYNIMTDVRIDGETQGA